MVFSSLSRQPYNNLFLAFYYPSVVPLIELIAMQEGHSS